MEKSLPAAQADSHFIAQIKAGQTEIAAFHLMKKYRQFSDVVACLRRRGAEEDDAFHCRNWAVGQFIEYLRNHDFDLTLPAAIERFVMHAALWHWRKLRRERWSWESRRRTCDDCFLTSLPDPASRRRRQAEEDMEELHLHLSSLSAHHQELIRRYYLEEYTIEEMMAAFHFSTRRSAVSSVSRSVVKLRERLAMRA